MKPEPLRALLDEHADPARAHDVARYLKLDTREVLGVPVPTVHETAVGFVRAAGLPDHRVLPHLAELAFLRRDFAAVRRLLVPLDHWPGMTGMHKVAQLWSAR